MNQAMWRNPRTQRNVALLRDDPQVCLWGPDQGEQACGDTGPGRMLEPAELARGGMDLELEEADEERFELRRALEAHVGALVEAKVDAAEFQGCILELRKDLARVKVMYQRAAARATKLEAMYYTLKDAKEGVERDDATRVEPTWRGAAA